MKLAPDELIDGKYRILRTLGEGGAGVVYAAEHVFLRKQVALKVLHPSHAASPAVLARFETEARATSQLEHENIVRVLDFGRSDGAMYLVMELLQGRSLLEVLAERRQLPPAQALPIITAVLTGLEAAHAHGVIHRDLKPENVFLVERSDGTHGAKLLDFGIARLESAEEKRLTSVGAILGTPVYMSPEQARGQLDVDHRADLHAVGVILYETLAGRLPYDGENYNAVLFAIVGGTPPPLRAVAPEIPPALEAIVMKAFAPDPAARYQSAAELRRELEGFMSFAGLATTADMASGVARPIDLHLPPRPPGEAPPATGAPARVTLVRSPVAAESPLRRSGVDLRVELEEELAASGTATAAQLRVRAEVRFERWTSLRAAWNDTLSRRRLDFDLDRPAPPDTPIAVTLAPPGGVLIELRAKVITCTRQGNGPDERHHVEAALDLDGQQRKMIEVLLESHPADAVPRRPTLDPAVTPTGRVFQMRRAIADTLVRCLAASRLGELREGDAIRRDVERYLEFDRSTGDIVVKRLTTFLVEQPGVTLDLLAPAFQAFKTYEMTLDIRVRLPEGLRELDREELLTLRRAIDERPSAAPPPVKDPPTGATATPRRAPSEERRAVPMWVGWAALVVALAALAAAAWFTFRVAPARRAAPSPPETRGAAPSRR